MAAMPTIGLLSVVPARSEGLGRTERVDRSRGRSRPSTNWSARSRRSGRPGSARPGSWRACCPTVVRGSRARRRQLPDPTTKDSSALTGEWPGAGVGRARRGEPEGEQCLDHQARGLGVGLLGLRGGVRVVAPPSVGVLPGGEVGQRARLDAGRDRALGGETLQQRERSVWLSGPVKSVGSSVHPPPTAWSGSAQPPLWHCWLVSQLIAAALAVCPTALRAVNTRPWT